MQELSPLLENISPGALPIVVTVLGIAFIYRKIVIDRKVTKVVRDKDSESIHDTLLRHNFEIGRLKDSQVLHDTVLNDLREQIAILNSNIARLSAQMEIFCGTLPNKK